MKFPLFFRREQSDAARRERQEQLERRLTQGLRAMSTLLQKLADNLEAQRLHRSGHEEQDRFLERHKDSKPE
jgi:hypothetical protein